MTALPTLKLRVLPTFPSAVVGDGAITVTKAAGVYTVGLNRGISPTWTGIHTFSPTVGDAIAINPAANSLARGMVVTQTGAGASVAGPIAYNLFDITNSATSSTAGSDSYGLFNKNIAGVRVNFSANSATTVQNAVLVAGKLSVANAGDTMGLNASMYSNIASTGAIYGVVGNASIGPTGSGSRALGAEFDVSIFTGGSAPYRIGVSITSYGNVAATTLDSGIVLNANPLQAPGIGWQKGITLSNLYGVAPIATTGDWFYVDSAQTIANVFNCANLTVTGPLFNFPNFIVQNTNNQNAAAQAAITNSSAGAGAFAHWYAGNGTNSMTIGIAGTGASPALYTGRAYFTGNGAAVILGTTTAQPVIQIINNAEAGRWDSATPGQLDLGVAGTLAGALQLLNATSGSITVRPPTGALGTIVLTAPATAGTLLTTSNATGTISTVANSLGADVAMSVAGTFVDGPSVAQGTAGTWFASGTVTITDPTGAAGLVVAKLWDGTTVIDTAVVTTFIGSITYTLSVAGAITNPAANLKITCKSTVSTTGKIAFNTSGTSKDSTITAIRIG